MGPDLLSLIKSLGYFGIWSAVFLECGVPMLFFLPGDSLLFTAGFLASQKILNIALLMAGCFIAAIAGNVLGYAIGWKIGLKLFAKGDTRFLKLRHLEMTRRFYQRHGAMAVITARFMPVFRTFVPFLAGMVQMPRSKFMLYTVAGAALWTLGLPLLGYFFGKMLPPEHVDRLLFPVILGIIGVSFLPSLFHLHRERRQALADKGR